MSTQIAVQSQLDFRPAQISDKKDLIMLENTCFDNDRLSERQLTHWLKASHKVMQVALLDGSLVAYGLVIMRKGTSLARLYSLAVLPQARGFGIAKKLLLQLETLCVAQNKLFLRLEVAARNSAAIALYHSLGYKDFGYYAHYYEDSDDAIRMQKAILHDALVTADALVTPNDTLETATQKPSRQKQDKPSEVARLLKVPKNKAKKLLAYPYYQQTTDFTCGPAALLMTMAALDENFVLTQQAELDIWRTATTIFMTSGHGGTHPLGLALAAVQFGYRPQVFINHAIPLFLSSVRNEQKKNILSFVEHDFVDRCEAASIDIKYQDFTTQHIAQALRSKASVMCLISSYQFDGFKGPHWVSVTHIDDDFLYIHDPEPTQHVIERQHVPVSLDKFERYTRYGKARLRTAIILRK